MSDIPGLMKKCFQGGSPPGKGCKYLCTYEPEQEIYGINEQGSDKPGPHSDCGHKVGVFRQVKFQDFQSLI